MQQHLTSIISKHAIDAILHEFNTTIKQKQLLVHLPTFLSSDINILIQQNLFGLTVEASKQQVKGMQEQKLNQVPKIDKDTLMVKEVERQIVHKENHKQQSDINTANIKNRSLLRRTALRSTQNPSAALSNRKSNKNSTLDATSFKSIQVQTDDDPQVRKLRQRTELRLQQTFKMQKMIQQKAKQFQAKQAEFESLMQDAPFTFDYQGSSIKNQPTNGDVVCYTMRSRMGHIDKKRKQAYQQGKMEIKQVSKKQKWKIKEKETQVGTSFTAQIPTFNSGMKKYQQPTDSSQFNLSQYRKAYGSRYSRLTNPINQSVTLTPSLQTQQDPFSERKHFKDSSLSTSKMSQSKQKQHFRKLALPRLNGKYKVLDRYEGVVG